MRLGNQSPDAMMRLVGAEPRAVGKGEQPLADRTHYFLGNDPSKWQQNVPHFGKVRYEQVYPGIDLVYYDKQGQLEYDFMVAPGADPSVIELAFENVRDVAIDDGALVLRTPAGEVRQQRPVVYQDGATKATGSSVMPAVAAASRHEVTGQFEQTGPHSIRFALGDYDPTQPLVIDPIVEISTLLGGAGADAPVQVKVDQKGAVWVLGSTNSHDFTRADDTSPKGGASNDVNIFLSELTEQRDDQGQPFWTVETFFFGGSDVDVPFSFEFDPTLGSDQILISGETFSTDFVGAPGPEPQMPQGFLFGLTRTPSGESLTPDKGHNPTSGESFEEFLFFKYFGYDLNDVLVFDCGDLRIRLFEGTERFFSDRFDSSSGFNVGSSSGTDVGIEVENASGGFNELFLGIESINTVIKDVTRPILQEDGTKLFYVLMEHGFTSRFAEVNCIEVAPNGDIRVVKKATYASNASDLLREGFKALTSTRSEDDDEGDDKGLVGATAFKAVNTDGTEVFGGGEELGGDLTVFPLQPDNIVNEGPAAALSVSSRVEGKGGGQANPFGTNGVLVTLGDDLRPTLARSIVGSGTDRIVAIERFDDQLRMAGDTDSTDLGLPFRRFGDELTVALAESSAPVKGGVGPDTDVLVWFYEPEEDLTIDAGVFGGPSDETVIDAALDPGGNLVVVGTTDGPYPTTPGAPMATFAGGRTDVFVLKVKPFTVIPDGVLNAASLIQEGDPLHPTAPGSIVSVFGNFAWVSASASTVPLSTELGDVMVTFDGIPAALFAVIYGRDFGLPFDQINAQMPWGVNTDDGVIDVIVIHDDVATAPEQLDIATVSPAIFTFEFGGGPAIVQNFKFEDNDVIDGSFAQPPGSIPGLTTQAAPVGGAIVIFANGLGEPDSPIPDGEAGLRNVPGIRVFVDGVEAPIIGSAVLHQTLVALNQVNAFVPGVEPGEQKSLQIEVNGVRSRPDVFIAVRPAP